MAQHSGVSSGSCQTHPLWPVLQLAIPYISLPYSVHLPWKEADSVTAQINDTFRFRGHEYAVAGISEGELFDPSVLDLKPTGTCTACWRGYQAVFALLDSRLVLDTLHVTLIRPGEGKNLYEHEV